MGQDRGLRSPRGRERPKLGDPTRLDGPINARHAVAATVLRAAPRNSKIPIAVVDVANAP